MGLLRNAEDAKQSEFYYTTLPPRAAGVDGKDWKLKQLEIPEGRNRNLPWWT